MADNALVTPLVFSLPGIAQSRAENQAQVDPQPIPATVTKIMGEMVEVQVTTQGRGTPFTLPKFIVPQAFSEWIREPTQVGDKGWLIHANYNLGGQSGLGGPSNYYGRSNLTPMVFRHISQKQFPNNTNRNLNQVFINGPEGTMNQTTDGKYSINVDGKNGQIVLGANGSTITFTKDSVTITIGGNSHVFTSTQYKSAGDVLTQQNTTLETHTHAGGPPPDPGS
jgi:hypothetical protein